MHIKEILTAILIGSASILPTANGAIMELLTNGDFATGDFTGWLPFPSGDQTIESGTARLNNNVEGAASIIKQERIQMGLLTARQEVTISFDYRCSLGPAGVIFAEIFSEIDGGGVSKHDLLSEVSFPHTDSNTWTTYTTTTTLGADVSGGFSFQLAATTGAVPGSFADIYFDNVSVMGEVIPEPASALLIVGSAGALSLIRRNKQYFTDFRKID